MKIRIEEISGNADHVRLQPIEFLHDPLQVFLRAQSTQMHIANQGYFEIGDVLFVFQRDLISNMIDLPSTNKAPQADRHCQQKHSAGDKAVVQRMGRKGKLQKPRQTKQQIRHQGKHQQIQQYPHTVAADPCKNILDTP